MEGHKIVRIHQRAKSTLDLKAIRYPANSSILLYWISQTREYVKILIMEGSAIIKWKLAKNI